MLCLFLLGLVSKSSRQISQAGEATPEGTRSALCAPHLQWRYDAKYIPHSDRRLQGLSVSPAQRNQLHGRSLPAHGFKLPTYGSTAFLHGSRQS